MCTVVTFLVGLFGMDSVLPDGLILDLRIIVLIINGGRETNAVYATGISTSK
jgi:hypothetical protein